MSIEILKTIENKDLDKIANLANEIWNECFIDIISQSQIDYMVSKFQSYESIKNQIENENYLYFSVYYNNKLCGYFGIKIDEEKLFLSKLYLHKDYRGYGIASLMLQKIFEECENLDKPSVYLTVNKNNTRAIEVYKTKGFKIINSTVTDIGEGYVMDDYIMEYNLPN